MLHAIGLLFTQFPTNGISQPHVANSIECRATAAVGTRLLPRLLLPFGLVVGLIGCDSGGSSSTSSGGQISLDDDNKVYSMVEQRRYEVLPGVGTTSNANVESWRWNDSPFRFGPLVECSGLDGFETSLAVRTLNEACTVSTRCNFSFDQSDIENPDGTRSPRFVVEVPELKAPIGLSYQLRGLTDLSETVTSSATFCMVPVNEAPFAENDSFTVVQGDVLQINAASAINLLSNDVDDIDLSNAPLSVSLTPLVAPQFATQFSLSADGGFTYLFDGDIGIQGSDRVVDTFTYQVSDGIHTSSADVRITVVRRNDPPIINGDIPGHTAVVGIPTEFDFSDAFTDPEGSQLQYAVAQGSIPAGFDVSVLGVLTGTASQGDAGNYTVTAIASDGVSSVSGNFLLSIVENQTPAVQLLADQSVEFGTLINLDASTAFVDPESVPLIFSLVSEPATDLVINPQSGLITGVLPAEGIFAVTVGASDGVNDPVSVTFQITQSERPNRAPVFSGSIDNQGVLLGQTPTATTGDFTDLDEDTLSYSISTLPAGMAFDTATGTLSGTPTQLGIYNLTIVATDPDGASTSSNSFTITVSEVPNEIPVFGSPVPDLDLTEGVLITPFTVEFVDPEGRPLSYTSTSIPNGLFLSADSGEITGTPTAVGIFSVSITAQDDAGDTATSNTFTITVSAPPNTPPAFSGSIDDVTVTVGTAISPISGTFTDSDSLTYSSTTLPAGITLNTTTGVITGTPTVVGTTSVSLTATDPSEDSATSNTFEINVVAVPNNPPQFLGAIPSQNAVSGSAISPLDISGFFSDIDTADTLVFSVASNNPLPAGLSLSSSGLITGTPSTNGSFSVVVSATDNNNPPVSSTPFNFTISSANAPPSISNLTPASGITLDIGDSETIEFSVTDESTSTLVYEVTTSSAAVTLTSVSDTEYLVTGSAQGNATITITITDELEVPTSAMVSVTVSAPANDDPEIESVAPSASTVTVIPGTPLSVAVVASDESPQTLVYTADSSDTSIATVTPGTAGNYTVTALPTSASSPGGSAIITLTVTDAIGQADDYTFTVTVPAPVVNLAPIIDSRTPAADPITNILVGDTDPISISVTDENASTLVYTFTALPAGVVSIDNAGGGVYNITGVTPDTATVTLTVTDDVGQSDSTEFDIQVPEPNQAPVFTGNISDQSYPEGTAINPLDVSTFFTDADNDALTFSDSGLPPGLSMSSDGIISGTPTTASTSSITSVVISAIDLLGSDTQTDSNAFDIEVLATQNQAPVFTGSISDQSYPEGVAITELDVAAFFTDADNDTLTFSDSGLPAGLSMSSGVISGTPTATGTTSNTTVIVSAIDLLGSNTQTDSNAFDIEVLAAPNQPPVFTGPIIVADLIAGEPIPDLDLSVYFTDPENDALTFSSSSLPATLVIDSDGIVTGTPVLTDPLVAPETASVVVSATDELGSGIATASTVFFITIVAS